MSSECYVTLATNDTYSLGALVLGHSLKQFTTRKLAILITPGVSQHIRTLLNDVYDVVRDVDVINSNDDKILQAMKRPELGITLTKVHCWRLTEFTKCVFMDADTLVLQSIDELFEREELSAVPDIGWPDIFNSGVFVFKPSEETFRNLVQLAAREGSFDGGDQGLLNAYFSDWGTKDISKHLSFIYNMTSATVYSYPPAFKKFGKNVKVVHFLGSLKPWMYGYSGSRGYVLQPHLNVDNSQLQHVQLWWDLFVAKVHPKLTEDCSGLAATLAKLDLSSSKGEDYPGAVSGPSGSQGGDETRKASWESGRIDYLGEDSFKNIQKKLDEAIGK